MTSPQLDVGAEHALPGHLIRFVRPPASTSSQDNEHLRRRHHTPEELPLQCISEVEERRGSLAESGEEAADVGKSTRLPDTPADEVDAPLQARTLSKDGSGESPAIKIDPKDGARVLRKIDRWLMPIMCVIYMLQYIDKSAMSYAAVYTFRQDRNLSSRDYSWLGTAFYLGYTAFEPLGSWLLQKTRTNYYMGATVVVWGGMVLAMAFPQRFRGLVTVRTLLGAAESVITPGFTLITARFYTRREQPFRFAIWYSMNGLGSMLGGLLGYGVGFINNTRIENWAWIFIVNGLVTILAGLGFFVVCPNSPAVAKFLSPDERKIAIERVRANQSVLHSKKTNWKQVRQALNPFEDPQGWLLFFATFSLTIPNGGLGNYFNLILQSYGYNPFQTLLLGIPTGAVQVVAVLLGGWISRVYRNMRIYVAIVGIAICLTGLLIQYLTTNDGARLFGYYIIVCFVPALAQLFSFPAANVTGYTKRITIQGMVFFAYGSGNAIGPQFWHSGQTPPYRDGMLACIICFSFAIVLLIILRLWYIRENRRRDRLQAETGEAKEADFSDITDMENVSYRYHL